MEKETVEYLEKVACIAHQNLNYLSQQEEALKVDDAGAKVLMGSYLQLYADFINPQQATGNTPSPRIKLVARTCCDLKREMFSVPRSEWDDQEEGLFKLMTAFMFLFKHLYVMQH